ncbi:MAG: hypothetical protein ACYC63_08175 [Armatimonadota bacterium]
MCNENQALRESIDLLSVHVVPLLFAEPDGQPEEIVIDGTLSLLQVGERRLIITAHHAWASYLDQVATRPELRMGFIAHEDYFWPLEETQLTGLNTDVDLVAFEATYDQRIALASAHKQFARPDWPPQRPSTGDLVIGLGYPARHVRREEPNVLWNVGSYVLPVSSVSRVHFILADEAGTRESINFSQQEELQAAFGGMSGGACFLLHELEDGNHRATLAGFQYETSDLGEGNDQLPATILVSHADHIAEDGTIPGSL